MLIVFSILLVSACNKRPENVIRIGILDGPSAVSFIQMIDQQTNIGSKKVEYIIKSEPLQIQSMMMQGELDFAVLPTVMAANLYNKGVEYRMVACPIWGTLYIVTNTHAKDINHLKGQTISVFGQGATSDILLRRILDIKNINGVNIDYNYNNNNDLAQALLMKKVKFAVVSEPMVSNLLAKDPNIRIVSKLNCEDYLDNSDKNIFVQTSFLVNNGFATKNSDLVRLVCESYSNSCNLISSNPELVALLLVHHSMSPNLTVAKRSIPLCNIRYIAAFALERELNRYLNIFLYSNPESIGGKLPPSDFIYQTF